MTNVLKILHSLLIIVHRSVGYIMWVQFWVKLGFVTMHDVYGLYYILMLYLYAVKSLWCHIVLPDTMLQFYYSVIVVPVVLTCKHRLAS